MKPRYLTAALFLATVLLVVVFPFINPCMAEDATACTWRADVQGNGSGWTFTDYYGAPLYWSKH